MFIGGAVKKS